MNITIPIYIHERRRKKDAVPVYEVRPLFRDEPVRRGEIVARAVRQLTRDIRKELFGFAREGQGREIAERAFYPTLEDHVFKLPIELRRQTFTCRLPVVAFRPGQRRVAFSPAIPDLWFEVPKGRHLKDTAAEVYTAHFRKQERESPEDFKPDRQGISGKAWVGEIETEIFLPKQRRKRKGRARASIGTMRKLWGAWELEEVGECLDSLYPDELTRAVRRDETVAELGRLLSLPDRRPVLLVGPRKAGKTAVVHEHVYRRTEARKQHGRGHRNVWLLSPQRLIAGMSFVGQWEERLLSILDEARRRDHTLYFDNLLGLYQAGVCADSDLSMAHMLKPRVERRDFRMLAEITPSAFRVLQERDRGFADQFHVLRVEATPEPETLQIMLSVIRRLEKEHGARFHLDALPVIMDLQRRYVHDTVFPGKAAEFAGRLAARYRGAYVSRRHVLQEFKAQSGLSLSFTDARQKLDRADILGHMRARLVGQRPALEAVADAVCRAKACLNDPDRPLGTFLFLGPTGVGKTECARALARYLFGHEDRMLRFDMNEYIDPSSVPRLIGTFREPEGLLTREVRRRPFCVLLLDEIEKAHPDVFDLLLQVLGEGRLTDAVGRTVDFSNALIVMTSNLGAREVRSQLGFQDDATAEQRIYADAARAFFRPEFFNRIDRIVPFAPLTRQELGDIAGYLIADLLGRHGLRQRRCALRVDYRAMQRVVEAGYHPRLGARALKRVVEQQLAQPVSACLAGLQPGEPTIIDVHTSPAGITVNVRPLVQMVRVPDPLPHRSPDDLLKVAGAAIQRLGERISALRPAAPMEVGALLPAHEHYAAMTEQMRAVRKTRNRLTDLAMAPPRARGARSPVQTWRPRLAKRRRLEPWDTVHLRDVVAARDMEELLADMREGVDAEYSPTPDNQAATRLVSQLRLLELMVSHAGKADRILLCVQACKDADQSFRKRLYTTVGGVLGAQWGYRCTQVLAEGEQERAAQYAGAYTASERRMTDIMEGRDVAFDDLWGEEQVYVPRGHDKEIAGWLVEGPGARILAGLEEGVHLETGGEEVHVAVIKAVPLAEGQDVLETLEQVRQQRDAWVDALADGTAAPGDDPFGSTAVVRSYDARGLTIDFRTGLYDQGRPRSTANLYPMLVPLLPLPAELGEDL